MGVEYEHWILPKRRDYRPKAEVLARLVETLRQEHWVVAPDLPHFSELRGGFFTPSEAEKDDTGGYASLFGNNPNFPTDPNAFIVDPKKIRRGRPIHQVIPAPLLTSWLDERIDEQHPNPLGREIGLFFPIQIPQDLFSTWEEAGIKYPFTFGEDDVSNYHQVMVYSSDDFVTHDSNTFAPIDDTCRCGAKLAYDPGERYIEYVAAFSIDRRISRTCPACKSTFDPSVRSSEMRDGWEKGKISPLPGGITFRFAVQIDCHKGWPRDNGRIFLKPEFRELVEHLIGEACDDVGGLY